jgi:hypothetical protein
MRNNIVDLIKNFWKGVMFFFIVFLAKNSLLAQPFQWSQSIGSSGSDIARMVRTDASNQAIVVGDFSGTVDFDPGPLVSNLTSTGVFSAFIQKLDPNGNLIWAGVLDASSYSRANSLVVDAQGFIYVSGWFTGTIDLDPGPGILSFNAGSNFFDDSFLIKLDPNGNLIWANSWGATNETRAVAVELDNQNQLLLTGVYSNSLDFDPSPLLDVHNAINKDLFIQKLDTAGHHLWVKTFSSSNDELVSSIATDATGNIYITGMFDDSLDFDPGAGTAWLYSHAQPIGWNAFLLKLDANGNFQWAKNFESNEYSLGTALSVCSNNDILVTGIFEDSLDVDLGQGITNVVSINGSYDAFTFRLSPMGNVIWNNVLAGPQDDYARTVAEDAQGRVLVGGEFRDSVDFDPGPGFHWLSSFGLSDIYLQVIDANGFWVDALQFGGNISESAQGVHASNGAIFVCGQFSGGVDLNPFAQVATHVSAGSSDAFLIKLDGTFLGITEGSDMDQRVFPNPSQNILMLQGWTGVKKPNLRFVNSFGQEIPVDCEIIMDHLKMDISPLPPGTYFCIVESETGIRSFKVIKI